MNKEKISPLRGTLALISVSLVLSACEDKGRVSLPLVEEPKSPRSPTVEMSTPTIPIEITPSPPQNPNSPEQSSPPFPLPEPQSAESTKTEILPNSEVVRGLAEIYLRDARANIIYVNGRRAIIPSRVYANGVYARDAFFAPFGDHQ